MSTLYFWSTLEKKVWFSFKNKTFSVIPNVWTILLCVCLCVCVCGCMCVCMSLSLSLSLSLPILFATFPWLRKATQTKVRGYKRSITLYVPFLFSILTNDSFFQFQRIPNVIESSRYSPARSSTVLTTWPHTVGKFNSCVILLHFRVSFYGKKAVAVRLDWLFTLLMDNTDGSWWRRLVVTKQQMQMWMGDFWGVGCVIARRMGCHRTWPWLCFLYIGEKEKEKDWCACLYVCVCLGAGRGGEWWACLLP